MPPIIRISPAHNWCIVGVPLEQTQAVISTLAPRLKPHQLFVDFTSLKVAPIQAMLKSPACVIGSHPLFGHIIDPKGQNIVLCAARPGGWLPWLEHFFTQSGLSITHMQPQAHDELMALVQGLTHFILMGFANTLRSQNADLLQLLQHSTPAWRALATPTAHMLKGHANLYAQIQTLNPHTPATLSAFIQQAQHLLEKIQTGQTPAIAQDFEKNAEFFASPSDKILQ